MEIPLKLLIFCPLSSGGIADYAHEQANALVIAGAEVTFLATSKYPVGRGEKYKVISILIESTPFDIEPNKLFKFLSFLKVTLRNFSLLARFIVKSDFKLVLMATYTELFAPLWAWRFRKLAKKGVRFAAIVHDPVRDFVIGPSWWHHWSIAEGYSFLSDAFVHEQISLNTIRFMPKLLVTTIPHGLYPAISSICSREEFRKGLEIPLEAKVMLSFGHIHPHRKNLDLNIRVLQYFPDIYLIVAGEDTSFRQRFISYYKELARGLGVESRCRWINRFIPAAEVPGLFEASDIIMLTYKKTFHSASGVLNMAVSYRKPCIASGGSGILERVVKGYSLGVWIKPDNLDALKTGLEEWREFSLKPEWERYAVDNSWDLNAKMVINQITQDLK
jgi:glycosyltransferase involved in cell wall biosynthesis